MLKKVAGSIKRFRGCSTMVVRKFSKLLTRVRFPPPAPIFMASVTDKYPENVKGKFYVDTQCIDCDLCRELAPLNFNRNNDGGYSIVYKQPEDEKEVAACEDAKNSCPVEAIGNDGI